MKSVDDSQSSKQAGSEEFARQSHKRQGTQIGELWAFVWDEKKFFLIPILIVLLIAGLFVVLGGSVAAPFIYSLF